MPVTRKVGRVGSAMLSFLVVSVLIGLLAGAMALPYTLIASSAAKETHAAMQWLPEELEIPPESQRSVVLDDQGHVLATFYDENRIVVPLEKIAPVMREALIAIEDHRFYEHGAFDPKGTFRALLSNAASGSIQGGGSSLTQQYVKMVQIHKALLEGDEKGVQDAQAPTVARKVQELRYAIALSKRFSKDEILERYLNIAYFGDGAYGVQAAAWHYFGTTADKLTLEQAAMLAGLVQNPDASNPVDNPEAALARRNVVLDRMADPEIGYITKEEAAAAKEIGFSRRMIRETPNGCVSTEFPFLCDYVRRSLLQEPALGKTPKERENTLNRGGLVIRTKINRQAQRQAEKAVNAVVGPSDPMIGVMVMMEPGTGLITAMAQSRPQMGTGAGQTYYNYAASRDLGGAEGFQSGSTYKAITIAAALERGIPISKRYNASSKQEFKNTTFTSCAGPFRLTDSYRPANSTISAPSMDMRRATAMSVNTYFIHLSATTGLCNIMKMSEKLGVEKALGGSLTNMENCTSAPDACPSTIPSVTLGALYVTPLSMAEAYNTFAGRGVHCDPVIMESVTTLSGKQLLAGNGNCKRVISQEVADGVNSLLQSVMSGGTGTRVTIPGGYPQAGKTGTTDSNAAVWFAGYTPELTGVAMIAVDNNNPYWKGKKKSLKGKRTAPGKYLEGSGSGDAGLIWRPAMREGLKGKPKTKFNAPSKKLEQGKTVDVPSVKGMGPSEARSVLEAAGFTVVDSYVYNPAPKGTYLGIWPSDKATQFGTISMLYSAGPKPKPKPKPKPTQEPKPTQTQKPQPTTREQPTAPAPTKEPTNRPGRDGRPR